MKVFLSSAAQDLVAYRQVSDDTTVARGRICRPRPWIDNTTYAGDTNDRIAVSVVVLAGLLVWNLNGKKR